MKNLFLIYYNVLKFFKDLQKKCFINLSKFKLEKLFKNGDNKIVVFIFLKIKKVFFSLKFTFFYLKFSKKNE